MQPGEVIWFLTGLGAGLTLAIVIFAGVAFADARRRRLVAGRVATPAVVPSDADFSAAARSSQAAPRRTAIVADVPVGLLPDVPPEPATPVRRRSTKMTELRNEEAVDGTVDEAMSTLAAEIARMQSTEPAQVTVELPAAEPIQRVTAEAPAATPPAPAKPPANRGDDARLIVEGRPAIERRPPVEIRPTETAPRPTPVATAPVEPPRPVVEAAPPAPEPEPPRPAPPKVPPLPRVAPARKFAPALPARTPAAPPGKLPPGNGIKR